jgi:hypothetical protein
MRGGNRRCDGRQAISAPGPDSDSRRVGSLARLSILADSLHHEAEREGRLQEETYLARQAELYALAESLVTSAEDEKR